MEKDNLRIVTIIIATLMVLVNSTKVTNPACLPLWYRKSVKDRPDLLVAQNLQKLNQPKEYWWGLCHLDRKTGNTSLVTESIGYLDMKLDYNRRSRTIYKGWIDSIKSINLDNGIENRVYNQAHSASSPMVGPVSLDWIGQNLYFLYNDTVNVMSLRNASTPAKIIYRAGQRTSRPKMVVHPKKGYLFIKLSPRKLIRLNQDGTGYYVICNYKDTPRISIKAIAMDYYEDRLYWLETMRTNGTDTETQIRYSNLDGEEVETLELDHNHEYHRPSIAVDKKYVYYVRMVGEGQYSMFRVNKVEGGLDENFEIVNSDPEFGYGAFEDFVILNQSQERTKNHPCLKNYGGCPGYCFGVTSDETSELVKKCL